MDHRPPDPESLREMIDEPPIMRVVSLIISQAVNDGATAVHIDPFEKSVRVRYRVGHLLHDVMEPPKHVQHAVVGRIKVLANLDISEWRIPQVGSINLTHDGRDFSVEVATFPCLYGEKVVLRLTPGEGPNLCLERLGLSEVNRQKVRAILERRSGLFLIVGPSRSGKNTILRALVRRLNEESRNIFSLEDSVLFTIEGVNQLELNPRAGLTAATALKSLMRGDPDVISIDRLHGGETVRLAMEAAASRHLVFGARYANDAAHGLRYIMEMGVENHLVAHALQGVWAQRLLPRLCEECKEWQAAPIDIDGLEEDTPLCEARGCPACRQTGFRGLVGVHEILVSSPELQEAILRRAPAVEISDLVDVSLRADALEKLKDGQIGLPDYVAEFGRGENS